MVGTALRTASGLVYSVLQCLASLECRILRGLDADGLAGLRVAAGTGGALAHLESTEANQGHRVALLQRLGDRVDDRIDRARGFGLGNFGLAGDGVDQFGFVHSYVLPVRRSREMIVRFASVERAGGSGSADWTGQ